ncbi:MAG: hypothetical protein KIT83_21760, partial [Bryobacterales bacterium]|nr:hypothetical protein [Bryobacterales bacterium]
MEFLEGLETASRQMLDVSWVRNLALSGVLLLFFLGLRTLVTRLVVRNLHSAEERQRWLTGSRNTAVILLALGLLA